MQVENRVIDDNIVRIKSIGPKSKQYNSYVVKGTGAAALIDSSPEGCSYEYLEHLDACAGVDNIDYFIFTHTDSARAGAIDRLIKRNPKAKVIATVAGLRNLKEIANCEINEAPAKDNAVIDLGGLSLRFLVTPNLGWPDTMMIYCEEKKCLFSGEMFANRDCTDGQSDDFKLFPDFVKTAYERAASLEIDCCCPSEGEAVLKDAVKAYGEAFIECGEPKEKTAAVIYASTEEGYTAKLAKTAAAAMSKKGLKAELVNCCRDKLKAIRVMNKADVLCFASPTIHRNAVPEIMDVISRIDRVNKLRTPCMVIGSYGWGGEALGFMAGYLKLLKLKVFEKPFGVIMKPSDEDLKNLEEFTERFIDKTFEEN